MKDGATEKAWFYNIDSGERIDLQFNPTEYTMKKTNNFVAKKNNNANTGEIEFNGGNPIELSMKLFFDTSFTGDDVQKKYTSKLWSLTMVTDPSKKSPPPRCRFHWGSKKSIDVYVTSISEQVKLFLPSGVPVRAVVDISLKQQKDDKIYPFQNPTSGGYEGYRTHVVRRGDTIDKIVATEYGNTKHWRDIAILNNVDDPRLIPPGTKLLLPRLPKA
ncbi:MAG: LysM peptidoglycan-binding domain-containing protein [Dehalococcoidia bacterium]